MKVISVIGSGYYGLSAAAYLAKEGHKVHVFEKNSTPGGRSRQFETENGYRFDMGPSWYWMPDVFENFFNDFGYKTSDLYQLRLLEPSFEIIFGDNDRLIIPSDFERLCELFESLEAGSAVQLKKFMSEAELKYRISFNQLIYKPGLSLLEYVNPKIIKSTLYLHVFSSFGRYIRKYFSNHKLISLMEFPILFLGAMPADTPALYSLMNYAGLKLGTWYPMGGFISVVNAIEKICFDLGVEFHFDSTVQKITVHNNHVKGVVVNGEEFPCDGIIASADYHHVDNELIPVQYKNYDETYWNNRVLAPSSLIFYLGINKKINNLSHHTLFFDQDFNKHASAIYKNPSWPEHPQFYISCPSKTDPGVAPEGKENIFILIPIASVSKTIRTYGRNTSK